MVIADCVALTQTDIRQQQRRIESVIEVRAIVILGTHAAATVHEEKDLLIALVLVVARYEFSQVLARLPVDLAQTVPFTILAQLVNSMPSPRRRRCNTPTSESRLSIASSAYPDRPRSWDTPSEPKARQRELAAATNAEASTSASRPRQTGGSLDWWDATGRPSLPNRAPARRGHAADLPESTLPGDGRSSRSGPLRHRIRQPQVHVHADVERSGARAAFASLVGRAPVRAARAPARTTAPRIAVPTSHAPPTPARSRPQWRRLARAAQGVGERGRGAFLTTVILASVICHWWSMAVIRMRAGASLLGFRRSYESRFTNPASDTRAFKSSGLPTRSATL